MTSLQIQAAEIEKSRYCSDKEWAPLTPWHQYGRIASQTLQKKELGIALLQRVVVAFIHPHHQEIEESWCERL